MSQEAAAYPSCHPVGDGIHAGWVISPSQGGHWSKQLDTLTLCQFRFTSEPSMHVFWTVPKKGHAKSAMIQLGGVETGGSASCSHMTHHIIALWAFAFFFFFFPVYAYHCEKTCVFMFSVWLKGKTHCLPVRLVWWLTAFWNDLDFLLLLCNCGFSSHVLMVEISGLFMQCKHVKKG